MNRIKYNYMRVFFTEIKIIVMIMAFAFNVNAQNWSSFNGPNSNFSSQSPDNELIPSISKAKLLWTSEEHDLGFGKGSGGGGADITSGGHATPIIHNGKVYLSYFRPSGNEKADQVAEGYGNSDKFEDNFLIHATDYMIAVDLETGKTVWKNDHPNGMHCNMGKRGGWAVTSTVYKDKVFHLTTIGKLYAYDTADGSEVWSSPTNINHSYMQGILDEHLNNKTQENGNIKWQFGLKEAGGVLIVGDYQTGMYGIDPDNGDQLWHNTGSRAGVATPTVISLDGKEYVLTGLGSTLTLTNPENGNELWSVGKVSGETIDNGNGLNNTTLVSSGQYVMVALNSSKYEDYGRLSVIKVTKSKPELVKKLADEDYVHPQGGDFRRLPNISAANGNFFVTVRKKKKDLLIVEASSGKILDKKEGSGGAHINMVWEDHVITEGDATHSGPAGLDLFDISDNTLNNVGGYSTPFDVNHGYEMIMLYPYDEGKVIYRTGVEYDSDIGKGGDLRCYDVKFYPHVLDSVNFVFGNSYTVKSTETEEIDFEFIDRNNLIIDTSKLDSYSVEATGSENTINDRGEFVPGNKPGKFHFVVHAKLDSINLSDSAVVNVKSPQSISCSNVPDTVYKNEDPFLFNYCEASSGLPVTYTAGGGPIKFRGDTLEPLGAPGNATIYVDQEGNDKYTEATRKQVKIFFSNDEEDTVVASTHTNRIQNSSDDIHIYPNPTSGIFSVEYSSSLSENEVRVYNLMGDKVKTITNFRGGKTNIDISGQPDGVYFIKIGEKVKRIFKK